MVSKQNLPNKSIGEAGKVIGCDKRGVTRCIYSSILSYLHETVTQLCLGYRLLIEKFDYPLHTHNTDQHRFD